MPKESMTIQIDNLTLAQKLAITDMLAMWQYLGGVGASREVSFMADGDGDFHPKILVDGWKPPHFGDEKAISSRWRRDNVYYIDYDRIAWALRDPEPDVPDVPYVRQPDDPDDVLPE